MALPVRVARRQAADPTEIVQHDFDRMIRRFLGGALAGDGDDGPLAAMSGFGVDIREDENHIYIEADLPGFRKDEVTITLEENVLTIVAEHREEQPAGAPPEGQQPGGAGQEQRQRGRRAQGQDQAQGSDQGQAQQGQQAVEERRGGEYLLRERQYRRLVRSFVLPHNVDEQNIQATLDSGVLRITLTKREDAKRRRIPVS